MAQQVAAFTDTYLPTVNGVTYTIKSWRDRWQQLGRRMDVVFPKTRRYDPTPTEFPVRSVPFPLYDGYRLGTPRIPSGVTDVDVVHAHTPFAVGLAALRLKRRADVPLVASYHTPSGEYAPYLSPSRHLTSSLRAVTEAYERWFYDQADLVLTPSITTRQHVLDTIDVSTPVRAISNGVDVEFFRPVDATDFRRRYDLGLEGERTLVGYTGRHGYEKELTDLLAAVDGLEREFGGTAAVAADITVVFGGDGPARADLEERAEGIDADVRFLGFLDREELPAFYSALDVFAFPSPVETQGLVALEANACGTPVVGVDSGALSETVVDDVTGYNYREGDVADFRRSIVAALDEQGRLEAGCLERRSEVDIATVIEQLRGIYEGL
ncbi:glycosyltransferase [Halobacteria archaeon AArc-m2/3/4]|uniref:Glycosyltransferase n=1 Tax=Natronoglomus mannanivorans TaxID=2979990 RepID=A0AAP2YW55_9EURY|nr:glycosyltransferase [Halobacteria archaeon AArc-xg1-1]MCU4971812.1 glycosyltransferase [Halobacteria archaeon AArc-m2/3/4]